MPTGGGPFALEHIMIGGGAAAPPKTSRSASISGNQVFLTNGHQTHPTHGAAPTGRIVEIVDGTATVPLTGMGPTTPTFVIERWDASALSGSDNTTAGQVSIITPSGGHSDGSGSFAGFIGYASMQGAGTGSGISNVSTHVGLWGIGQLESGAEKAFSIGVTATSIIDSGSGTNVRATGAEVSLVNNRGDATGLPDAPGNYYTLGMYISSGGSNKALSPLFINATGAKWVTGIYLKDIVDNGIGLTMSNTGHTASPMIKFVNSTANACMVGQSGDAFGVFGANGDAVLYVNLSSGELQIVDTTKTFPSRQTVSYGIDNSAGVGFKVLCIPN